MKNKTELKKFYELLLAKLPKESVPILRTIFSPFVMGRQLQKVL